MKASGIVRRIDDLGRIVIPREIRRILHIKEGDPLELFYDSDGVLFKKYNITETTLEAIENLRQFIVEGEDLALYCQDDLLKKIAEMQSILKNARGGE